jgi:predicted DNA-binding antitoxin AbrB/MazE fold protein
MVFRRCQMSKIIEAVFENGILRPLTEPHLKNHQRVRIEILSGDDKSSVESQKKTLLEFAGVGKGRFTDVARNHDRYLYSKD